MPPHETSLETIFGLIGSSPQWFSSRSSTPGPNLGKLTRSFNKWQRIGVVYRNVSSATPHYIRLFVAPKNDPDTLAGLYPLVGLHECSSFQTASRQTYDQRQHCVSSTGHRENSTTKDVSALEWPTKMGSMRQFPTKVFFDFTIHEMINDP